MKQLDAQSITSQMINMLRDVKSTYEQNNQDITYLDSEYNDLTHAMEFLNLNASQGFDLYKQVKTNRIKRRQAKDQNFQLKPLYDLVQRNTKLFKELNVAQNEIQKVKKSQKNRSYNTRVRNDMQKAFDKANGKKEI